MVEATGHEPRVDAPEPESRESELERVNEALRAEVIEARHRLLVNRDHVIGTEAEIGRLNRDVMRLQTEVIASRKRISALQKRKDGLKDRTEDLQAKLTVARRRTRALRAELDRQAAEAVPLTRRVVRRLRRVHG